MPTYAFRDEHGDITLMAPEFEQPIPIHAQRAGDEGTEIIRRQGRERRLERETARWITDVGNPHVEPYDGPVPAAAVKVEKLARSKGFDTKLIKTLDGCVVEGIDLRRRIGFRAHWTRGKTSGGTWHSGGRDTYKLVDITDRPIGIDAKKRVTKAKHRHDAKDTTRLVLVASPRGIPCNITEIERRIKL